MISGLQDLLESPRLPEIVGELQARLDAERIPRQRFYEEVTDEQKAEFINGQVIMHSPALARHIEVRRNIEFLLWAYVKSAAEGKVFGEKALCVFPRNDYEPGVCYFGPEKSKKIEPETMRFPIPDFIVEVLSDSTEKRDRGVKFADYQDHGVREYWIVNPVSGIVEQFVLVGGRFELILKSGSGEILSHVVRGFCIPIRSIFDVETQWKTTRQWMAAPEG